MPHSKAQVRLAHAVMEGKSHAMPKSVAQEMISKMHGKSMKSLPEHTKGGRKK